MNIKIIKDELLQIDMLRFDLERVKSELVRLETKYGISRDDDPFAVWETINSVNNKEELNNVSHSRT